MTLDDSGHWSEYFFNFLEDSDDCAVQGSTVGKICR